MSWPIRGCGRSASASVASPARPVPGMNRSSLSELDTSPASMARASSRPVTALVTDPASKTDVPGTGPHARVAGPDPGMRQATAPPLAPADKRATCSRSAALDTASTREASQPSWVSEASSLDAGAASQQSEPRKTTRHSGTSQDAPNLGLRSPAAIPRISHDIPRAAAFDGAWLHGADKS